MVNQHTNVPSVVLLKETFLVSTWRFVFAELDRLTHTLPCHVCDGHACVLCVPSSSSSSSSFCGLYAHPFPFPFPYPFPFLPSLQTWDLDLHGGDLFCDPYDDPLLESGGMDLGKDLQEELLGIHLVPLDRSGVLELHKAWPPEVQLVP